MHYYSNNAPEIGQVARVRLQSDISAAAFRTKQTAEVITWYRLRALNITGSGVLRHEAAYRGLIEVFGLQPWSAIRALDRGNGKYWIKTNGRVVVKGQLMVMQLLGIARLTDTHHKDLPADQFIGSKNAKAQLYASIHKPQGIRGNPMSRQTIGEMTGLHKIQQRRYEKEAKVKRTANFSMVESAEGIKPQVIEVMSQNSRILRLNKRLGNIYHSQQSPGNKGLLRKANKVLKSKSCISGEAITLNKRFFSGIRKLYKALRYRKWGGEGYHLIRNTRRRKEGRLEWLLVVV